MCGGGGPEIEGGAEIEEGAEIEGGAEIEEGAEIEGGAEILIERGAERREEAKVVEQTGRSGGAGFVNISTALPIQSSSSQVRRSSKLLAHRLSFSLFISRNFTKEGGIS